MKTRMLLGAMAVIAFVLCQRNEAGEKAPHGGVLLEIGEEVAHVEMVHDAKTGKLTLYILDGKAEKAESISGDVKINLKTSSGPKQLDAKPVDAKDGKASQFEVTDDALKAEKLKGRIALKHKDKKYNLDIENVDKH